MPGIDIHHIDGDHSNNHPLNLQAVTLDEHYDIHKDQKDFYAAFLISARMDIKPEDWMEMARKNGQISGKSNWANNIGLRAWIENNPEEFKRIQIEAGKISGNNAVLMETGIHGADTEQRNQWSSMGGKAASEMGLGFKAGHASAAGKIGGKKGGQSAKENRTGWFALTPEKIKERNDKGALTKMIKSGRACAWPRQII